MTQMKSTRLIRISIIVALKFTLVRSATIKTIVGDSSEDVNIPAHHPKPDLGCILFGDVGCQITCNVMCDLYGCQSNARCVYELYCDCQETYEVSSAQTTATDYSELSFDKLWNYKFQVSKASKLLRRRILNDSDTFDEIIDLLRNPHKTGIDIKKHLIKLHPEWKQVRKLKAKKHGHLFDLVTESEEINDTGIKQFVDADMEPLIDQMHDKLQKVKYKRRLATVFDNTDEDEIKHIVEQILRSRKDSLYDYASNYLQTNKGLQVDKLKSAKSYSKNSKSHSTTIDDIDQLILVSVVQKLLEVKEQDRRSDDEGFTLSAEMATANDDLYDSDFSDEISKKLKKRTYKSRKTSDSDKLEIETYSISKEHENDRISENHVAGNFNQIPSNGPYPPPYVVYHGPYPPLPPPSDHSYSYYPPPPPHAYNTSPPADYSYDNYAYTQTESESDYENSDEYQADSKPWWNRFWNSESEETYDYKQNSQNDAWWTNDAQNCCTSGAGSCCNDDYIETWNSFDDSGLAWADDSYSNSVQSWDLGNSGVTMVNGGAGNTGMQWKLGKSSITLTDDGRGNAVQSWDLGNSGVHLQQSTSPWCWTCT